mmetsp:Transcript_26597/g.87195  ORF Transcript_26597/g.87195 Transcript_26597/m.87195 type:complete len:254 (+) Transcript_26597:458-1219(+)
MLLVKGCHTTSLTLSTWPRNVVLQRLLVRSQSRALWSSEHDARKSPESWKAAVHTACVCSCSVTVHFFFSKSHSLTVQSPLALASMMPLGWNETPATQSLCPSPLMMSSPPGTLHIFHVLSSEAVARMGFFGCIARFETLSRCPLNVLLSLYALTSAASNLSVAYGLTRGSTGSAAALSVFFVDLASVAAAGSAPAGSSAPGAGTEGAPGTGAASKLSTLAWSLSRSSRISIFSFIATSYLWRSSLMVGSYCA